MLHLILEVLCHCMHCQTTSLPDHHLTEHNSVDCIIILKGLGTATYIEIADCSEADLLSSLSVGRARDVQSPFLWSWERPSTSHLKLHPFLWPWKRWFRLTTAASWWVVCCTTGKIIHDQLAQSSHWGCSSVVWVRNEIWTPWVWSPGGAGWRTVLQSLRVQLLCRLVSAWPPFVCMARTQCAQVKDSISML